MFAKMNWFIGTIYMHKLFVENYCEYFNQESLFFFKEKLSDFLSIKTEKADGFIQEQVEIFFW